MSGHAGRFSATARRPAILLAAALMAGLAGCDDDEPAVRERIRAIKTVTVSERPQGAERVFSGAVEAVDSSVLSFEVAGNVSDLLVEAGDVVAAGAVLATLDRGRFELAVEAAEAAVARAEARNSELQAELGRQRTLFERGVVAGAALEEAVSAAESAVNELRFSRSQRDLALRDLQNTDLLAPFDAVVGARRVDRFQEVARGAPVYDVFIAGGMQARINVPETTVNALGIGQQATIRLAGSGAIERIGKISEIGSSAEAGNTYPVKVRFEDPDPSILPGMTATVTLMVRYDDLSSAFLLPAGGLLAGERTGEGFVFRFDPESSTVERVPVGGVGVRGDMAVITEGLSEGDVIAVAGVTFLRDGQNVKLMDQ